MANSALSVTVTPVVTGPHTLAASVSGNALTVALKTRSGTDPSAADGLTFDFQNGSGGITQVSVAAATSITVSSGSTLGTANGALSRIWIVGFNDAGTFRMGVINCHSATYTADAAANIAVLTPNETASSTTEGGAGAADTGQTFYTGSAVTSKYYVILGYVESTQATAGTWATSPSKVIAQRDGMPVPGDVVQRAMNLTAGARAANDTSTADTTNSGVAITAKSLANIMRVGITGYMSFSLVGGANVDSFSQLARGTTSIQEHIMSVGSGAGGLQVAAPTAHNVTICPSSGANTYLHRQRVTSTSTLTTANIRTLVEEIMG